MNDLWINIYGFDEDAIFDNEDDERLTKDEFFGIIRDAKVKLEPPRRRKKKKKKNYMILL